jgi:hypothetical protein
VNENADVIMNKVKERAKTCSVIVSVIGSELLSGTMNLNFNRKTDINRA